MKRILMTALVALAASPVFADENELIKFICNNHYAVADVALNNELIIGLSPLPGGCQWISPVAIGKIGQTIRIIDIAPGVYSRITEVTVNGMTGYSAGIVDLLS